MWGTFTTLFRSSRRKCGRPGRFRLHFQPKADPRRQHVDGRSYVNALSDSSGMIFVNVHGGGECVDTCAVWRHAQAQAATASPFPARTPTIAATAGRCGPPILLPCPPLCLWRELFAWIARDSSVCSHLLLTRLFPVGTTSACSASAPLASTLCTFTT